MNKKDYKITEVFANQVYFKTEVTDQYGNFTCVYMRTREAASHFVLDWWEKAEEREQQNKVHEKAIREMILIDEMMNIEPSLD